MLKKQIKESELTEIKEKKEWTMDIGKANLYAMVMIIPLFILFIVPYLFIWKNLPLGEILKGNILFLWIYIIGGIIIHELLHGITWALFCKNKFRSIKFGINLQYITPYCHCKEPLKVWHYVLGAAMPLIVLGIIPSFAGILSGNAGYLIFGVFFSWAAGGDIIAIYAMRKLNKNTYVSDHPDKLGFIIEEEENTSVIK